MLDDVCVWTCGRAWLSVPSRRSSLRCVCEWALLSPLFGEFHCSLPEWHDLLPHSGADWLQYWPYINLVRRKCWQDRQSRHSTEMGRAAEYTTSLADKIFVLNWNYCTAHSTNIFFCPRLTWGCTNYHDWFQTQWGEWSQNSSEPRMKPLCPLPHSSLLQSLWIISKGLQPWTPKQSHCKDRLVGVVGL